MTPESVFLIVNYSVLPFAPAGLLLYLAIRAMQRKTLSLDEVC